MLITRIGRFLQVANLLFKTSHIRPASTNITSNMARYIERCQQLQQIKLSDDLCKEKLQSANFMLFSNGKPFLKIIEEQQSIFWTNYNDVRSYFIDDEDFLSRLILLDVDEDFKCRFAVSLPDKPESILKNVEAKYEGLFFQQRAAYFTLPHAQSNIVCQGSGILLWNRNYKFCPNCGHDLISYVSGWQKKCGSCKKVHYPQTSPVVITLVVNENQKECVLVRQPGHYKGMYTAVAGFVELGETIEDAVKREIAEEIGVEIKSHKYLKSQYWIGPNSNLMIGCFAIAKNTNIIVDKHELEDARWFSIEEVKEALKNTNECKDFATFTANADGKILVPPGPAIAHDLIMEWANQC